MKSISIRINDDKMEKLEKILSFEKKIEVA